MKIKKIDVASFVINKFGGVRMLSRAIKINPSAISRWKKNGVVPINRWEAILKAAKKEKIEISLEDLYPMINLY